MKTQYNVLYCSLIYKKKKIKSWSEGSLEYDSVTRKAVLFDETRSKLDQLFLKQNEIIELDSYLDMDYYFCCIESFKSHPSARTLQLIEPDSAPLNHLNTKSKEKGIKIQKKMKPLTVTIKPKQSNVQVNQVEQVNQVDQNQIQKKPTEESLKLNNVQKKRTENHDALPKTNKKPCFNYWNDQEEEEDDNTYPENQNSCTEISLSKTVLQSQETVAENKLYFPTGSLLTKTKMNCMQRMTRIPTQFESIEQYQQIFESALYELIQIQINTHAIRLDQKQSFIQRNKSSKDLEKTLRSQGLNFYISCISFVGHDSLYHLEISFNTISIRP